MAFNLFIAYDLMNPGQNYDAVRDRIQSLGQWYQSNSRSFTSIPRWPPRWPTVMSAR